MYEIATTFWVVFSGFCLTIATVGGVVDALLRSGHQVGRSAAAAETDVAPIEPILEAQPLAEAA